MHFITNSYRMLFMDQLVPSKATCSLKTCEGIHNRHGMPQMSRLPLWPVAPSLKVHFLNLQLHLNFPIQTCPLPFNDKKYNHARLRMRVQAWPYRYTLCAPQKHMKYASLKCPRIHVHFTIFPKVCCQRKANITLCTFQLSFLCITQTLMIFALIVCKCILNSQTVSSVCMELPAW